MKGGLARTITLSGAALLSALLAGCATNESSRSAPKSGQGLAEYQRITTEAAAAVQRSLLWVDKLAVQTNACPPKLIERFSSEVDQLQIDSIRIRSRARAIQARGDAYFEDWANKANAPKDLPQLHDAFNKVKAASSEAGKTFEPFLSGLRKLRVELETSPAAIESPALRSLISSTRESGRQVLDKLTIVSADLKSLAALLSSRKPVEKT